MMIEDQKGRLIIWKNFIRPEQQMERVWLSIVGDCLERG